MREMCFSERSVFIRERVSLVDLARDRPPTSLEFYSNGIRFTMLLAIK